jgi:hypothetical protein
VDNFSRCQAVVTLLLATGAIVVTFWSPGTFLWKLVIVFLFVVFGITTVWLQEQKETRDKASAEATEEKLVNWQRGDPKNPARIVHMPLMKDGVLLIRFGVENPSAFPAYDISARVWDIADMKNISGGLDDILSRDIASVNIPSLAPTTMQLMGQREIPPTENIKRFAAQVNSRVGAFSQNINAARVGTTWLFAIRVRVADVTGTIIYQRVDDGFPLNDKGHVDW